MTDAAKNRERLLTFSAGGWVLILTAALCATLIVWAVAPAFLVGERPPGDGQNVETYGFDLSTLLVPQETFVPIMRHRDMVPVMHEPEIIDAAEVLRINEEERGKYLVSRDRVVGVEINGEARAYPVMLLVVHEIVHDVLGGVPIAVTYNWPGDSVRVFDRRFDEDVRDFGISGLASNANGLLYDVVASDGAATHLRTDESSLWSQLTGIAIAGPAADAGLRLRTIPAQVVNWAHWTELYPETTVIARDSRFLKRYRRSTPDDYFRSPLLAPFPIDPIPERNGHLAWKDRVIVVHTGREEERRIYSLSMIRENARKASDGEAAAAADDSPHRWTWTDNLDGVELRFVYDVQTSTAAVLADSPLNLTHCFWFAWYAAEQTLLRY